MNSQVVHILEILSSANSLGSLGFSSGYNFDEENAEAFFNDFVEEVGLHSPIFSGIVILEEIDGNGNFTIVDGLQRLTTLGLLLSALCEAYRGTSAKNEESRNKIMLRYLISENDSKLLLSPPEKEIYKKIVFSLPVTGYDMMSNVYRTYNLFLSKIRSRVISATEMFKLISRVQFMVVLTDKTQISARELYQSLNGNKDDQSQVNLITSFISQNFPDVAYIWREIIDSYKSNGLFDSLKFFIKDFLTVQNNGKIPDEKQLYLDFKKYFLKLLKYQSVVHILEYAKKYAAFYLKIIMADFEDPQIQEQIRMISANNGKDAYPYLIEALDDLQNNHIDQEIFLDILTMINSFLMQRSSDGSNITMNFASLSCDLNKMLAMKDYECKVTDESMDKAVKATTNKFTINEINKISDFEV